MKSLRESLLNEAKDKMYMMCNHYRPGTLYIVKNPSNSTIEELQGYNIKELETDDDVTLISWNNDQLFQYGGGRNLNQIKKEVIDHCKKSLDKYKYQDDEIVEEVETGLLDINPMVPRNVFEKNPWKYVEKTIKNSYVNGDSYRCYAFIDLKKMVTLMQGEKGENYIEFYSDDEEFQIDMFGEIIE